MIVNTSVVFDEADETGEAVVGEADGVGEQCVGPPPG